MLSTFKKLFGRQSADVVDAPAPRPAPAYLASRTAAPGAARAESPARSAAPPANMTGVVGIPLKAILARLPAELMQRVRQLDVGGAEIALPMQRIFAQIGQGFVRISFGELRQASPPGTFGPETDRDRVQVDVPLNEILSRLDPTLLPRRPAQKQVVVPSEVTGPFGGQGQTQVAISTAPAAPQPTHVQAPAPSPVAMPFTPVRPVAAPQPVPQRQPVAVPFQPVQPTPPPQPARPAPSVPTAHPFQPAIALAQGAQPSRPAAPVPHNPPPSYQPIAHVQTPPAPPVPAHPGLHAQAGMHPQATTPAAIALNPRQKKDLDTAVLARIGAFAPQAPAPVQPGYPHAPHAPHAPAAPSLQTMPQTIHFPAPEPTPEAEQEFNPANASVITPIAPEPEPVPELIRFSAPAPAPAAAPAVQASAAETRFLTVGIAELAGGWPGLIQQEISRHQLMTSSLALPVGIIESALKQGKIMVPWKVLRSWIKPPVLIPSSPNDAVMLELPLKIITPLFLAEMRAAKPQKKLAVDPGIPNLFSNRIQNAPQVPVIPATVASAPAPESTVVPLNPISAAPALAVAASAPIKQTDTNYFAKPNGEIPEEAAPPVKPGPSPGTAFLQRYATPNEIVSKAAALDGVDGTLIALPDGLLVASRIPQDMNADTVAGFLPQIFNRVSQCTKELRLGELNNLNFTVGNVPWKIFKVGAIFFAAFGRPGEPLPSAQLAGIAAELDRKAK